MAVRLSALSADRPLTPGKSLIVFSVKVCVYSRVIVRLEGLGLLKNNPVTSTEIKSTTFRLILQYLNQLRYRVDDNTPLLDINSYMFMC
jgi:hypothetical protein